MCMFSRRLRVFMLDDGYVGVYLRGVWSGVGLRRSVVHSSLSPPPFGRGLEPRLSQPSVKPPPSASFPGTTRSFKIYSNVGKRDLEIHL